MKVGISVSPTRSRFGPVLYDEDFDSLCGYVSGLGYAGIELSLVSPAVLTAEREQSISRHGLEVFSIATGQSYVQEGICLYSASDRTRGQAAGRLKSFIPIARAHSCPIIIGGTRDRRVDRTAAGTRWLACRGSGSRPWRLSAAKWALCRVRCVGRDSGGRASSRHWSTRRPAGRTNLF